MDTTWTTRFFPARGGIARLSAALCVLCTFSMTLNFCVAFNVDIRTAIPYRGPTGSMFGFSLTLHRESGNNWVIIGAPKAQTNQPNVTTGGGVYRCSTDAPTGCFQLPFDRTGSKIVTLGNRREYTENKTNQWFGATVVSSGENGPIVACAPRYVYFSINMQRREPVGTCWIARNNMGNFEEYSPCRTSFWGFHRQGSCQAGLSAALTEDGKRLYVGAVGSWYWQGQVFSKDLTSNETHISTSEAPEQDDDSFLGYSSAVGEFTGDTKMDVVVGMPRGNNLTGKVVLFNSTLQNLYNISGEQLGSYFGYSLCVSDVNGDGLDDIIVGAPLYTDLKSKENKYEEGRVYVIYQNTKHEFDSMSQLDGEFSKGRFGLALASLKDINRDEFQDIAIGAPYAGKDERGIVYIYNGSPTGIMDKPSQVITPDDFGDSTLTTLGFSLSGGLDMDSNDYPDILIGAYDSDKAFFMRSRPVVNIVSTLKLDKAIINLEDKMCRLKSGSKVACIEAEFCLVYNGIGVNSELDVTYNLTLDADQKHSRAFFLLNEKRQLSFHLRVRKNIQYCNSTSIYIQKLIRDKLTPIVVKTVYDIVDLEPYRYVLKPIRNENVPNVISKEIHIEKNCGKDEVCIPDLQLLATANVDQYLIGSVLPLEIDVIVHNSGEDAFEAMLYMTMPLDVNYIKIEKIKSDFLIICTGALPELTGVNELVCDIGNPLPANETLNFKILLAPSRIVSSVSDLVFSIVINSTNKEKEDTLYNNEDEIQLPVRVEVAFELRGISQPETVTYNKSQPLPEEKIQEMDVGPEVVHVYEVRNKGPSSIRKAEVYILWPTYTLDKEPLLYLMAQPDIIGKGQCEVVDDVNPLNLREIRRRPQAENSIRIQEMKKYSLLDEKQREAEEELIRRKRNNKLPSDDEEDSFENQLSCGATLCTRIYCTISNLIKDEDVVFTIRSRLWRETYDQLGLTEVQTSSQLVIRVTALPYGVNPKYLHYKMYKVSTKVNLIDVGYQPYTIPWWIFLLAIWIGLLLLALLALLLWKLGFFERKRPQEQSEKEPLYERNGYRMARGDTAL